MLFHKQRYQPQNAGRRVVISSLKELEGHWSCPVTTSPSFVLVGRHELIVSARLLSDAPSVSDQRTPKRRSRVFCCHFKQKNLFSLSWSFSLSSNVAAFEDLERMGKLYKSQSRSTLRHERIVSSQKPLETCRLHKESLDPMHRLPSLKPCSML